jgi:mono/diheme cytochrome c family protein
MMRRFIVVSVAVGLAAPGWGAALVPTGARAAEQTPAPTHAAAVDAGAEISHGKSLFISYGCGWCHESGGRKAGRCPQLMHSPHDDSFIINRIVGGSPGRMPAFGAQFTDTDIRAIIAYIRSLEPES